MQRVRVYRNLTKGCLSVQTYRSGIGWRVAFHCDSINLFNVSFEVKERARQRVIASKRKNVHAFIVGNVSSDGAPFGHPIRYNPYDAGYFHRADTLEAVYTAKYVTVSVTQGIKAEFFDRA